MTFAFLFLMAAATGCAPVHGPMLQGRDLALADPQFSSVPVEAALGYAPAPGSRRVISEAEITRWLTRFGVDAKARELCFEYAMADLDSGAVLKAMQAALPGTEITIVETGKFKVPEGKIVFPLTSLLKPPQSRPEEAVIWRGYVEYAEGRRFTIWAKVRVAASSHRIVPIKELAVGTEISATDLEVRTVRGFPDAERWAESVEEVAGKRAGHLLRAGAAIPASALVAETSAVMRGDSVTVEVEAGAARLKISARAESGAAVGEAVKLRNPKSGKVFEARVTGKGAASLIASEVVQ